MWENNDKVNMNISVGKLNHVKNIIEKDYEKENYVVEGQWCNGKLLGNNSKEYEFNY